MALSSLGQKTSRKIASAIRLQILTRYKSRNGVTFDDGVQDLEYSCADLSPLV
jgi:hypothetical protein